MKIDFEEIRINLEKKANALYRDNHKLRELLETVKGMIMENKELSKIIDEVKLMMGLLKDWLKGDYRELEKSSAIMIIVAFLYLINPLDLIPDFLFVGFIDDIAVIAYVFKKLQDELDRYKEWKGIEVESRVEFSNDDSGAYINIDLDEDIIEGDYEIYEE